MLKINLGVSYTCAEKALTHGGEITPIETVDTLFMPAEFFLREMSCCVPETDIRVETSCDKRGLHVDWEDVPDGTCVPVLLGITLKEWIPSSDCSLFFEGLCIVDVDDTV